MDEEEYAAYVRARMWERTREGMMEEQERMRQERAKRKKEREREQAHEYARDAFERGRFEKAMDESLRRGRERKRRKAWGGLWDEYSRSWEEVDRLVGVVRNTGEGEAERARKPFRNVVFWPVESGKRRNVSASAVEEFMRHAPAPPATGSGEEPSDDEKKLLATLKTERVRWHPDKIQHRYGVLGIDEVVMRSVTEVFQIVDRLWNELREKMA